LVLHSLAQSQDRTTDARTVEPAVVVPQGPTSLRDPVLLRPLVSQVGSLEIASDLVARRLESIADLGVQLRALERLSARFPVETRESLSAEARHRLDQLALDYVDASRRAWREWEMSAGSFQAVLGGDSKAPDPSSVQSFCGAWEDERSLAVVASRLQDLFSQGFTSTSGQSQVDPDLSAESISSGIRQLSAILSQALSPECLRGFRVGKVCDRSSRLLSPQSRYKARLPAQSPSCLRTPLYAQIPARPGCVCGSLSAPIFELWGAK
jgi:hypothetical protein